MNKNLLSAQLSKIDEISRILSGFPELEDESSFLDIVKKGIKDYIENL